MRAKRTFRLGLAALLTMAGLLVARPLCAADDALTTIRGINPLVTGEELPTGDWRVTEQIKPDSRATRKVDAARIIRVGNLYFVGEMASQRWLVGTPRVEIYGPAREIQVFRSFASLEQLSLASSYPVLPVGQGFSVREVVRFGEQPIAMASQPDASAMYVLLSGGDVWKIDRTTGRHVVVLRGREYLDVDRGTILLGGLAVSNDGRLWIAVNQQVFRALPVENNITIFRTSREINGLPAVPQPWLRTQYPWGLEPHAYGIGRLKFGPDGMLYVASGSRTDAGEMTRKSGYWSGAEHELTSCVWRLDPAAVDPTVDVFARGVRRCGGFAWDDDGDMLATDIGPDLGRPAELDLLRQGAHYGFPYFFSRNESATHLGTGEQPTNDNFVPPLANIGPVDGASRDNPLYTLDAYSRPWDVAYVAPRTATRLGGSFLVSRLGNDVPRETEVGFDVLQVRLRAEVQTVAQIETLLTGCARPVGLLVTDPDTFYVLERSRAAHVDAYADLLPGRLLEVRVQ